ncbi:MAG: TRAP transporter fused permease subunit [Desulfobacterales bacterium]|nr:TRAP transporter fused permease subunit [Desulfobacterales bacterium]
MENNRWTEKALLIIGAGIALVHIYFNTIGILPGLWRNAVHFAGFALMCPLIYPLAVNEKNHAGPVFFWLDILLGVLAAVAAVYMVSMEDAIYERGVRMILPEWIFGVILILAAIELTRRTTGWIIPVLIILSLSYVGWWGELLDGVFEFKRMSPETILFRSVYGDDGIFGNIASISSTFVFMFILFGAFLLKSGAGDFVIDLARSVAGRLPGGPGLVAVFASGLTGTISGSAIANTASTGVITIPLMKKAGFPPKFAGGVEAAASTGGQIMPPIMGAGAFVMASYTQIPYPTIIAVSILPAILYFSTVAFFVMLEASRSGVTGRNVQDAPKTIAVLRRGGLPFLVPIAILIGMLIAGFTPSYAAAVSIAAVVIFSWFTPNKIGLKGIIEALTLGAKNMVMTAILLCAVGLVVNVIATTGVGNTFSLMINNWAGDSLMIAFILIALASLILGMGLPVTASYIVLGTLSAPALYNLIVDDQIIRVMMDGGFPESARAVFMIIQPEAMEMLNRPMAETAAKELMALLPLELKASIREMVLPGPVLTYALLSAHMTIFWLSQDSNVTPPVCLCGFTAAAIAKTPPMATGLASWKVAKGLYIVPLLFIYTEIIGGSLADKLEIFGFALVGLFSLACGLQGYMLSNLSVVTRILLMAAGTAMLWPGLISIHLAGLVLFIIVFAGHRMVSISGTGVEK